MAVIREDMVSIGFQVENNPFAELTAGINEIRVKLGILDKTEVSLKDVGKEAGAAAGQMKSLADSINAPPKSNLAKPLEKMERAADAAAQEVAGLTSDMKGMEKLPLTDGVEKLGDGIEKPRAGFKELLGQAKTFAKEKLDTGMAKLGEGIGKPRAGFKELLGQAKTFAKEKLDAGIKSLPPQLQLGLKIGGKLAGVLGKAAKISFKTAVSGIKSLAIHAAGAVKSLGRIAVKGLATGITAAGTALAGGAAAAFKFGSAYETATAKTSTLVDQSKVNMEELNSDILKLSTKTGEDAAGLQEATYQALSAGVKQDAGAITDFVNVAVKSAKGGFTDTATAVDGLTSTLNAYGMETEAAQGLANQFLITQNKGKTTFGELAGNIGGVAPTARAAGVGVDQLLAGVASLTANGVGTSEAMTGMKSALSNIIKPSGEAAKMAKSLGLDFSTAALQSKGLAGFLDDVKKATGGDTDKMAKLFGSVEALNTVLTLTSDQGSQLMNDTLNEMATNTTALDDAYNTMTDTAEASVQKGLNSFKNLGIGIFTSNEGVFKELTGLFAASGQELYDAFTTGGLEGLTGQIGATLTKVLVTLTGYLPQLVRSGADILRSLIDGIMQNREQITGSVMGGLTAMLMGIMEMLPDLLTLGGSLLMSLVQGINQQLPALLPAALAAVQNLCDGLIQNGPVIIESGINLIMQLFNGLVAAAPSILTAGVQLIFMLVEGLVGAIPDLIAAVPQLVGALITALMSVDWLKLGLDIIKGIGSGLVKGIKGLFSKGKDAGKEVGDGVTEGLAESTSQITDVADTVSSAVSDPLKPDTVSLSDYGVQTVSAYSSGMQAGVPMLTERASAIAADTASRFDGMDLSAAGYGSMMSLNSGLAAGSGQVLDTAGSISGQAADAAQTDVDIAIRTDLSGMEQFRGQTQALVTDSETALNQLPTVYGQIFGEVNQLVQTQMTAFSETVRQGLDTVTEGARAFSSGFKKVFAGISLLSTGVSIMAGLNRGMASMKPLLLATAGGIASGITSTINGALDIHSPSKVTEETGKYTDLGLIQGMNKMSGKVEKAAGGVADRAAAGISPMKSRYSPEDPGMSYSRTSQVSNYSPVFNLTLNGASASDSNKRKITRWVKEAISESVQGMGRTNPKLREV